MGGHEERSHRKYSPSRAERIAACPGSVALLERVPARPDTKYSIEGRKAHVVLEAALDNRVRDARVAHKDWSYLCMELLDSNDGGPYDNFYFSVQMALDHVYDILDRNPDAIMWLETYVDPPSEVAPGEVGGYCDICIYIPSQRRLIVIDFKHGAGVTKAVYGNRQALQYAGGFLFDPQSPLHYLHSDEDEPGTYERDVDIVTLCIIQPRAFHPDGEIREYDIAPFQVQEYLWDMDEKIRLAQAPDAPLIPQDDNDPHGSRQCQFCDAAATCPARTAKALAAVNTQFATVGDIKAAGIPDPQRMAVSELEFAMMHIPTLIAWANAVEKRLYELAAQGTPLQHHKLVEAQARRKWNGDPNDLGKQLAALCGVPFEQVTKLNMITIGDAEKLIKEAFKRKAGTGKKKEAAEDALKALAYLTLKASTGNLTLVSNDDPRPAADRATIAFQQIGALLPDASDVKED